MRVTKKLDGFLDVRLQLRERLDRELRSEYRLEVEPVWTGSGASIPARDGASTGWKWIQYGLEVEQVPFRDEASTGWKWSQYGLEVERVPARDGASTGWKWSQYGLEVEQVPVRDGASTG